jgi:hypothetical protein
MIRQQIIDLYPHHSSKYIAELLGVTISKVYNTAWSNKVKKSAEYLLTPESGRIIEPSVANQFKPGHTPHNKGKQISAEIYEKVAPTMFKKGNKPHNTKPNGTINIRADKSGRLYQYIKIKDSHWELLQRYVWTQANGEIPQGSVVIFLDGNYLNCELNNLQVISRKENMARNTIQRYPAELQEVMKLTCKLKRKTNGKQQTK